LTRDLSRSAGNNTSTHSFWINEQNELAMVLKDSTMCGIIPYGMLLFAPNPATKRQPKSDNAVAKERQLLVT